MERSPTGLVRAFFSLVRFHLVFWIIEGAAVLVLCIIVAGFAYWIL